MAVPVGYLWSQDMGLMLDPDRRIQDVVRTIFPLFERLGSARQVLLLMRRDGLTFPRPTDRKHPPHRLWRAPVYRSVISILRNPFYAGAYAYGTRSSSRLWDGPGVSAWTP